MADFDPMILVTRWGKVNDSYESLVLNGRLEKWTNPSALADNWIQATGWTGLTLLQVAGVRTGGGGTYAQRIQASGYTAASYYQMYQTYTFPGHARFDAYGHYNRSFLAYAWVKNNGSSPGNFSARIIVELLDSAGGILSTLYGNSVSLSSAWQEIWISLASAHVSCRALRVTVRITCDSIGAAPDIYVDDIELYESYTFARNPSMPDEQDIDFPGRTFSRTIGGTLLRGRSAAMTAKFDKVIHFGLISKTQVESLRSLYLHDCPMEWTPNHPLLPSALEVRWIGQFNPHLISPSAGTNHYALDAHLVEY